MQGQKARLNTFGADPDTASDVADTRSVASEIGRLHEMASYAYKIGMDAQTARGKLLGIYEPEEATGKQVPHEVPNGHVDILSNAIDVLNTNLNRIEMAVRQISVGLGDASPTAR